MGNKISFKGNCCRNQSMPLQKPGKTPSAHWSKRGEGDQALLLTNRMTLGLVIPPLLLQPQSVGFLSILLGWIILVTQDSAQISPPWRDLPGCYWTGAWP